jgi:hypothetical protein
MDANIKYSSQGLTRISRSDGRAFYSLSDAYYYSLMDEHYFLVDGRTLLLRWS